MAQLGLNGECFSHKSDILTSIFYELAFTSAGFQAIPFIKADILLTNGSLALIVAISLSDGNLRLGGQRREAAPSYRTTALGTLVDFP